MFTCNEYRSSGGILDCRRSISRGAQCLPFCIGLTQPRHLAMHIHRKIACPANTSKRIARFSCRLPAATTRKLRPPCRSFCAMASESVHRIFYDDIEKIADCLCFLVRQATANDRSCNIFGGCLGNVQVGGKGFFQRTESAAVARFASLGVANDEQQWTASSSHKLSSFFIGGVYINR